MAVGRRASGCLRLSGGLLPACPTHLDDGSRAVAVTPTRRGSPRDPSQWAEHDAAHRWRDRRSRNSHQRPCPATTQKFRAVRITAEVATAAAIVQVGAPRLLPGSDRRKSIPDSRCCRRGRWPTPTLPDEISWQVKTFDVLTGICRCGFDISAPSFPQRDRETNSS